MDFNLSLTEQEVNKVVNALAALPYRDSFELIGNITKQVQTQMAQKAIAQETDTI